MNLTFNPACKPAFKQQPKRPNEGHDRVATVQDLQQMEDRIIENQKRIQDDLNYSLTMSLIELAKLVGQKESYETATDCIRKIGGVG